MLKNDSGLARLPLIKYLPCFSPVFRVYTEFGIDPERNISSAQNSSILASPIIYPRHQYHRLNMERAAWIDVLGLIIEPYVYGNMSMGFSVFFEKSSFKET